MNQQIKITALIPAYNEAKNILNVLAVLKQVSIINEILVVCDGCTDNTAEVVEGIGDIKIIELPDNLGKTQAVLKGINQATHDTILLCDADLIHLTTQHLVEMINKYTEGYEMVIMDKGSQPWVFRSLFQSVPAESGTRILDRRYFSEIPFLANDRWQLEIRINDYFLENQLSIGISPAPEIYDLRKYRKYPFFSGLILDLKGGFQILFSDGLMSAIKNIKTFRKIKSLT